MSRWLGGARVALVSPRWEEPFGLVVAEALACGTPVAGFRRGASARRILDDETGRLAEPDSATDLARAAREAAQLDRASCRRRAEILFDADTDDRRLRGRLSPHGREWARAESRSATSPSEELESA